MNCDKKVSKTIAERIGIIRTQRGETQAQLGKVLDVDRSTVANWESCKRSVSAEALFSIAEHYNISVEYLLGRSNEPTNEPNLKALSEYTGLSRKAIETIAEYNKHCKEASIWNSLNAIFESDSVVIKYEIPIVFDHISYAKSVKETTEAGYKADQTAEDIYMIDKLKKKGYYIVPFKNLEGIFRETASEAFEQIITQLLDVILPI